MRKIIVVSLGIILVSCLSIVIWNTTNRTEDRESTFDSGVDTVSGVGYSTTITGGEESTSLVQ
jgi:outer membrane lipoprotein-sorting protein